MVNDPLTARPKAHFDRQVEQIESPARNQNGKKEFLM
jgi:hypothetical protein